MIQEAIAYMEKVEKKLNEAAPQVLQNSLLYVKYKSQRDAVTATFSAEEQKQQKLKESLTSVRASKESAK